MNKDKEEISSSLNALAKTSIVIFIGLILSKAFTYIYRIIAARYFGPEDYGLFSLALMIMGWFAAFASLGLSDGLLRSMAIYKAKGDEKTVRSLFRKSTILLAITGFIAGAIMFSLAGTIANNLFHNANLEIFIQIFSIGVPLITIATPLLSGIRAMERVNAYSAIYNILQNGIKVAAIAAFVMFGIGSQAISMSYLAGLGAVLLAAYLYARAKLPAMMIGEARDRKNIAWKDTLSYSWPLLFYGIVSTLLFWVDSFAIGYYKDAIAVGWYNAAVPLAMLIGISSEIFLSLFFPMINRLYAQRKEYAIGELGKQVTKWILIVNLPIFAVCIAFPEAVINIIFGSEYVPAANALRILSVGTLIYSIGTVPMNFISMVGKSKILMINIIFSALLNLALNIILVPMPNILGIDNSSGINGAAIATAISFIFFAALYFLQAYKYTRIIPLRRKILNVLISTAVPLAGLVAINILMSPTLPQLMLIVVAFGFAYYGMLLLTGSVDRYDREILSKVLHKIGLKKSK